MVDLLLQSSETMFLKRRVILEFSIFKNIFEKIKIMDMDYKWKLMISPLKKIGLINVNSK